MHASFLILLLLTLTVTLTVISVDARKVGKRQVQEAARHDSSSSSDRSSSYVPSVDYVPTVSDSNISSSSTSPISTGESGFDTSESPFDPLNWKPVGNSTAEKVFAFSSDAHHSTVVVGVVLSITLLLLL